MNHDEPMPPVFEHQEPGAAPQPISDAPTEEPRLQPATDHELKKLRKPRPKRVASQALVLGWCLWLLGSWAILLWVDAPVAAVRGMVLAAMVGMMVVWPLVRLSEGRDGPRQPPLPRWLEATGVFFEWLSLTAVFQAVVWPLRVTGDWELEQTLWLDGAIASWTLLCGALVALGLNFKGLGRSVMMGLCMLLLVGEPLAAALARGILPGGWQLRISPIPTVWALSGSALQWHRDPWAAHVIGAAVAAVVAWVVVFFFALRHHTEPADGPGPAAALPHA